MNILAISHSCVADVNQQQFIALSQLPNVKVSLIMPAIWRNDYTGTLQKPTLLPEVTFNVFQLPIAVAGNVSLHLYTRLPLTRLRQLNTDVILSTQEPWSLSGLQAVFLSKFLRVPLVFQTNQNLYKRYPFPFSWIERLSYQTVKMALAYSEEARCVLIKKGLKRASRVVPYGTDLSLFHPQSNHSLRQKLGVEGKVVLGFMGRIVKEKGLETLVEAMQILQAQQTMENVVALIVGTGAYEEALKKKIREANLDNFFVFTGAVPHRQAGEYMNCIDIFVLPSLTTPAWKEQFGRVIIESMACGIPVVGSDSGQIPILIRETGGGSVFREGDAKELAERLSELINNPEIRAHYGQIGRSAVSKSYTFEAVAQQLHDIFQSLTTL